MKVKDITIGKYLSLKYTFQYDIVFDMIEAENRFNGHRCFFDSLTFDEVSVIRRTFIAPTIEDLKFVFRICYGERDFFDCSIIDFFRAKKFLDDKIVEITKLETKLIQSIPDPKVVAAGLDRLNKYGEMNTKIDLGAQFGKSPEEIGRWKYIDVLFIRARNNDINEIQKAIK